MRTFQVSDVYEHNPEDHDDPSAGPTWLVGLIGTVLLGVIVMTTTALYYNVKASEFEGQFVHPAREEVLVLRRQQEALLRGGWVEISEQGETVRKQVLPVERAMELVVGQYGSGDQR